MSGALCWLDGVLLPMAEARIDPADRGFTLGDGVFETIAVGADGPAHLARHLARLDHGAAVLGFACPWSHDDIAAACARLAAEAGSLRLTLTRGPAARGILPPDGARPTLLITAAPAAVLPDALTAIVSHVTRRNQASPLSRIKSLNYLDSILARAEAARAGADDAILLNTAGDVAEATASNLFARIGGRWCTPPVADGALPGIARALLLEAGLAEERRLSEPELERAEAVILTSSLSVRQVSQIGTRILEDVTGVLGEWRKVEGKARGSASGPRWG